MPVLDEATTAALHEPVFQSGKEDRHKSLSGRPSKEGLPPGWYKGVDPKYKRPYYFNKKTRRSTWTKPASDGPISLLGPREEQPVHEPDAESGPSTVSSMHTNNEQPRLSKSSMTKSEGHLPSHHPAASSSSPTQYDRNSHEFAMTTAPVIEPPKVPTSAYLEKRSSSGKSRATWIEVYSPQHRRTYFFNRRTKESRWTKPPELLDSDRVLDVSEHAHPPGQDDNHLQRHNSNGNKSITVNDCDRTSTSSGGTVSATGEVPALRTAWSEIEEARRQLQQEREQHMMRLKSEWKVLQSQIQELRELTLQSSFAPVSHPKDSMGSHAEIRPQEEKEDAPLNIAPAPSTTDGVSSSAPAAAFDGPMGFVMMEPLETKDVPLDTNPAESAKSFMSSSTAASAATGATSSSRRASAFFGQNDMLDGLHSGADGVNGAGGGSYTAGLLSELEEYADSLMERRQSIHRLQGRARGSSEDSDFDKDAYIAEVLQSLGGNEEPSRSSERKFRPGAAVRENGANSDTVIPYGIEEEEKDVDEQLKGVQAEAEAVDKAHRQVRELEEGCYYKLLEVEPDASPIQLKKAYHKSMMKYHPDKFQGSEEEKEEAQKRSAQIGQAYQCLSDPWERKLYDRMGLQQYSVHASVVQSFINFIVSGTSIRKHPHSRKRYGWKFLDRQFVHRRQFWLSTDHEWLNIAKKRNLEPSEADLEHMKRINVKDVIKITKGIQTETLEATGKHRQEHRYLSIHTNERSYDLEAPDHRQREFLFSRLTLLVIHLQKNEEWFEQFYAERNPKKKKTRKRQKNHKSMGSTPSRRDSGAQAQGPRRATGSWS